MRGDGGFYAFDYVIPYNHEHWTALFSFLKWRLSHDTHRRQPDVLHAL